MSSRPVIVLFFLFFKTIDSFGQLTAGELEAAFSTNNCAEISAKLEKTPLVSEAMKFQGAVCFYRNGEVQPAMDLFIEVGRLGGERQDLAHFWLAKCHAALRQDSLAMAVLTSMPPGSLNFKMLSQKEFGALAAENSAFQALKSSVTPHFNIWTGLLTAIAGLGFLLGFVLFFGKTRFSAGERKLSVVVFAFSLILTCYILIWTGYVASFPYLQNTWQCLTLLVGPSLYFYLKDTFKEDFSAKEMAWHALLPAVSGLATVPVFGANLRGQVVMPNDFFQLATSETLLTGHLIFYAVLIYFTTKNDWQIDTNIRAWTRIVAGGMAVFAGAFLSYFMLVKCSFFNPNWDYTISFVMAVGILAVGYMGLLQKRVFRSEPIGNFLPAQKYLSSSLTPAASESIKRKMEQLLNEQQVFKENELRLADLAAYLDITYHQLSQVINEHYGVNFFDLINRYRVAHVKQLLASPNHAHLTIMQIAYEAGFNNKASFNRYFKREIGMTPSAFRIFENQEAA